MILGRREPRLPVLRPSTVKSEAILARMAPLLVRIVVILGRREPRLPVLGPSTTRSETILVRMTLSWGSGCTLRTAKSAQNPPRKLKPF